MCVGCRRSEYLKQATVVRQRGLDTLEVFDQANSHPDSSDGALTLIGVVLDHGRTCCCIDT